MQIRRAAASPDFLPDLRQALAMIIAEKGIMLPHEYDRIVREMIQHESVLTDHRMMSMWALQGLIFTTCGLLWEKNMLATLAVYGLGMISSISVGHSILVSIKATNTLIKDWESKLGDSILQYPRIEALQGHEMRFRYLLPWRLFPFLFPSVWLCLGVLRFVC